MKTKLKEQILNQFNRRQAIKMAAVLALAIAIPQITYASSVFTEVDTIMDSILLFLSGPYAWFVCVGSIIVALAGWAISDGGGNMVKTGSKLAIVFAILFNAGTMVGRVYNKAQGLFFQ
ncbi:hypothetical protein SDC9_185156 [bioreactor metagenome]|uniref:TrbC/VIRB2 family protein n=1 Tax=bioreactor metagenome TaxID=1076179 RepID=A0A645HGD9_9ZZZZ